MASTREPLDGRQKLLLAAAEAFAREGFAGASVGEIAKAAGVTQPLVNHHFGSKKGLFQAVLDEHFAALERALAACETSSASLSELERLRALVRTYVVYCGRHPQLVRMLRVEAQSGLARELNRRWQRRFAAFFEARLARATEAGVLREVAPHFLFFAIVGIASELFSQEDLARSTFAIDVTAPAAIEAAADFAWDLLLRGVGTSR